MNLVYRRIAALLLLFGLSQLIGVAPCPQAMAQTLHASQAKFILGDYDKEPRIGDHVDTDRLVKRLSELGANTYMWLIWHNKNDWNDLKTFLPKANAAGISVWVYLVPPSETPMNNAAFNYSEPFKADYVSWAKEISSLSLENKNLVGYVIDDFWGNVVANRLLLTPRFTPDNVKRMVQAGKQINPKIKFYPLMYFNQIDNKQFINVWEPIVDGVVAAYPPNVDAVRHISSETLNQSRRIPLIVMVASDGNILNKFSHVKGTQDNVEKGVLDMLALAKNGEIEGVVTYCLDLSETNTMFLKVKNAYTSKVQ